MPPREVLDSCLTEIDFNNHYKPLIEYIRLLLCHIEGILTTGSLCTLLSAAKYAFYIVWIQACIGYLQACSYISFMHKHTYQ